MRSDEKCSLGEILRSPCSLRITHVLAVLLTSSFSPLTSYFSPLTAQQPTLAPSHLQKLAHTYSIVAYDSSTGDLGVAVQSKFPNVGGIVP